MTRIRKIRSVLLLAFVASRLISMHYRHEADREFRSAYAATEASIQASQLLADFGHVNYEAAVQSLHATIRDADRVLARRR